MTTHALVTGATGFLGGHMARRLAELGWRVTGLGRNEAEGRRLAEAGIVFVSGDLRDKDLIRMACEGQQYVFHCGALSSPWGPYRDFYESNVEGTRYVVEGCVQHGVERLIHISTPSLYFNYRHRLNISEADPLPRPVNAYAATKLLAEQVVEEGGRRGLGTVILRPRAIFGPGDRALFPRLLKVNNDKGIPLLGKGRSLIDLTYVDNVADAMLSACFASSQALGRAYNISGGEPLPFGELLDRLFGHLDIPLRTRAIPSFAAYTAAGVLELAHRLLPSLGEPPLTRFSVGSVAASQTLDITLAKQRLGYRPRVSVEEGLEKFAGWWKEQQC